MEGKRSGHWDERGESAVQRGCLVLPLLVFSSSFPDPLAPARSRSILILSVTINLVLVGILVSSLMSRRQIP